jgi:DNA-binding CsgD family transcriptional regulator
MCDPEQPMDGSAMGSGKVHEALRAWVCATLAGRCCTAIERDSIAHRAAQLPHEWDRWSEEFIDGLLTAVIAVFEQLLAERSLTPAQAIACVRVLLGDVDKEIAARMSCSPRTATAHVATGLARLHVSRRGLWPAVLSWADGLGRDAGPGAEHSP